MSLRQGCTNPDSQVTMMTKFCTVAPNICGSSVLNLLYITYWCLVAHKLFGKFMHSYHKVQPRM